MALAPLKLADLQIATPIVETKGGKADGVPTAYFQRFIQEMNTRISASVADLSEILQELEIQADKLEAQQILIEATIDYAAALGLYSTQSVGYLFGVAGVQTLTPDPSGYATITHNSGFDPQTLGACQVFALGDTAFEVQMRSFTNLVLEVRLFDPAGVPLTAGSWDVGFKVSTWPNPTPPPPLPPTPP